MASRHTGRPPDGRCRCVIIGGGPAGLACGLYFSRLNCETVVIFREDQRARLIPHTWNVPGYPDGIAGDELIERCKAHARRYGAAFVNGEVDQVRGTMWNFEVCLTDGREFPACHVVFATGVEDIPPDIPRVHKYVGRGLRHCPICDGYEANGQRLAIFGTGNRVARHALYLTTFTDRVTILLNGQGSPDDIDPALREDLARYGIRCLPARVAEVLDEGSEIRGFLLEDGTLLEVDRAYSALGIRPRSEVAQRLGVAVDERGFIKVDAYGATNVEGVYAVGDVVNADYSQVVIGMGQAATAAIHIHARYLSEG
ncbi:MAG: NAD(P)/FAD-dependent oxidoreductase [Armatimonadetes bacterium]|nr:NAD(P)/FAD-dependent oxidoreductase [Armatimonadota bacterium]